MLDNIGENRNFIYLAVEGNTIFDKNSEHVGVIIELNKYLNGSKQNIMIGKTDGHANWIKWH